MSSLDIQTLQKLYLNIQGGKGVTSQEEVALSVGDILAINGNNVPQTVMNYEENSIMTSNYSLLEDIIHDMSPYDKLRFISECIELEKFLGKDSQYFFKNSLKNLVNIISGDYDKWKDIYDICKRAGTDSVALFDYSWKNLNKMHNEHPLFWEDIIKISLSHEVEIGEFWLMKFEDIINFLDKFKDHWNCLKSILIKVIVNKVDLKKIINLMEKNPGFIDDIIAFEKKEGSNFGFVFRYGLGTISKIVEKNKNKWPSILDDFQETYSDIKGDEQIFENLSMHLLDPVSRGEISLSEISHDILKINKKLWNLGKAERHFFIMDLFQKINKTISISSSNWKGIMDSIMNNCHDEKAMTHFVDNRLPTILSRIEDNEESSKNYEYSNSAFLNSAYYSTLIKLKKNHKNSLHEIDSFIEFLSKNHLSSDDLDTFFMIFLEEIFIDSIRPMIEGLVDDEMSFIYYRDSPHIDNNLGALFSDIKEHDIHQALTVINTSIINTSIEKMKLYCDGDDSYFFMENVSGLSDFIKSSENLEKVKICIGKPLSIEEYKKVIELKKSNGDLCLLLNVTIGNEISLKVNIPNKYGKIDSIVSIDYGNNENVVQNIPLQTIYKDFLKAGVTIPLESDWYKSRLSNKYDEETSNSSVNRNNTEQALDIIFSNGRDLGSAGRKRRRIARIKMMGGMKNPNEVHSKTMLHYKNVLGKIDGKNPEIFLTQGGAAANEAAIYAVSKMVPKRLEWLEFDFYFEHGLAHLNHPNDTNMKRAYFLSPDILSPERGVSSSEHTEKFQQHISKIISDCNKYTEEVFFLVIDRTLSLKDDIEDLLSNIPDNLNVIITASLTKHQRGDTKNFFGVSGVYSKNKEFISLMTKGIEEKAYGITDNKIGSFPRVTRRQLKETNINIELNRSAFLDGLLCSQALIPENIKLRTYDNNYTTLVICDLQDILEYKSGKKIEELLDLDDTNDYFGYKGKIDFKASGGFIEPFKAFDALCNENLLTKRDTFGLNETSYLRFSTPTGYNFGLNGRYINRYLRIAFNIEEDTKKCYGVGLRLGELYSEWLIGK